MTHGHHPIYVTVSILVAILGSWTALDLHRRVLAHRGSVRLAWLAAAALTMGLSIWAMHFIAMLGYRTSVPLSYDAWLTAASLMLAVGATGLGFFALAPSASSGKTIVVALAMGSGICLMHYTGMASIRSPVQVSYEPGLVVLSLAIAVGASLAALRVTLMGPAIPLRAAASLVLGFAVFGMHYTAMAAARFSSSGASPTGGGMDRIWLSAAVALATLLLLGLGLVASLLDRQRQSIALLDARSGQQRERHLRAMLAHLPVGVVVSENSSGVIRYANSEAVRLIGKDPVGLTWPGPETLQAVHPDGRLYSLEEHPVVRARNGERINRERLIYRRPDGTRFHAEVNAAPMIEEQGSSNQAVVAFADVTDRVAAEEALRQGQKMQALGQLTGGIAHDFNNLLTPVMGGLDLIRHRTADEWTKRMAERAFDAANRASRLTAQLLSFSRLQRLELKPVFVAPLVRSMEELLASTIGPTLEIDRPGLT